MSIFTKQPPYTQEAINQQVTNLERLHKLRDMCTQREIVADNSHDPAGASKWHIESDRYTRNIESGQRYLDYMQGKVVGKG